MITILSRLSTLDLITTCYGDDGTPFVEVYAKHAKAEILDPTNDKVYQVMNEIFQEVHQLFPDEYIHLGMDEVYYECWRSNPNITRFMRLNGMRDINEIEQYYVRKTLQNVRDIGYKYMTWQDPVDNGVVVSDASLCTSSATVSLLSTCLLHSAR